MSCTFWAIAASLFHLWVSPAASVVDGDTITLNGETIRLEAIDAPEREQLCERASGEPYACGVRAMAALQRLLKSGPVTCAATGRDRYGRTLALCRAGRTDINREMVKRGWAFAFVRYSDQYVTDEHAARHDKRGVWSGTAEAPWIWRQRQREGRGRP